MYCSQDLHLLAGLSFHLLAVFLCCCFFPSTRRTLSSVSWALLAVRLFLPTSWTLLQEVCQCPSSFLLCLHCGSVKHPVVPPFPVLITNCLLFIQFRYCTLVSMQYLLVNVSMYFLLSCVSVAFSSFLALQCCKMKKCLVFKLLHQLFPLNIFPCVFNCP